MYLAAGFEKHSLKSLISHKFICRGSNELRLYISEGKSIPSVYSAILSVESMLHSSVLGLQCFPKERTHH